MEGMAITLDEANIWKCLTLLESDSEASQEMMYDLLCESVVKQKGVASVPILKNLEKATGKALKWVPKSPKIRQGSSPDRSSELQQASMKETTSSSSCGNPTNTLTDRSPTTTTTTVFRKSLSTKKARRKTTGSGEAALASKTVKKIVKIQERFKELFDGYDSN